jgi:DNA-binding winged helix-turn-helix (wHTH) protein/tetratricopeptide (TPR) repeat protein
MPTSPPVTRAEKCVYEFDGFRVDPVRRRLLRGGETVPLTPKAFSILVYLLERRGKVVEKEELLERIWPDTHVTEANLTQNVSSLRKALGERANDHRYLVTVPGRGYSFVAEVREIPRESTGEIVLAPFTAIEPPSAEPAEPPAVSPVGREPEPSAEREMLETTLVQLPAPPHGRRRFLFAGLVLGVLLALAAVGLFRAYRDRPPPATPAPVPAAADGGTEPAAAPPARPALAVLGFRNLGKERNQAWLSTALSEMLVTELAPGSRVRLVPGDEVFHLKETFSLPYTEELSAPQLAQIRDHLGADLVIVGSYLALGPGEKGGLRVDLRVVKVATGDTLASLAEAGTEDGVFDLAARLGTRLRRALGWSDPSPVEMRDIQALLPANPAAARLYAEGLARLRAFDARGARDFLEQAAAADPESAVIRSSLSLAWTGLGDDARARAAAEKAVALAARLPQEQRLAIEARASEVKKDWARAGELYRSLWTFYPDNLEYGLRLADCLSAGGHGERALAAVEEMRKLPPPAGNDPRVDLAEAWTAKRLSDAAREMRAAASAEAKGRKSGATQIVAQALALEGDGLVLVGRSAEAAPRLEEARDLFARSGNQAALAVVLTRLGMTFHERGELAEAEKLYRQALAAQERAGGTQGTAGTALQTANLGMLDFDAGAMPQAQPLLESALAAYTAAGDRVMATRMDYAIASVLLGRGNLAAARERFDSVVAISRQTGNRTDEARALSGQGFVLERLGALGEARYLQDQAYEITRQLGDPIRGASALAASAGVLMRQGELAEAEKRLAQALAMKRQGGDRLGASEVLGRLAELAARRGNLAEAERLGAEQTALARGVGSQTLVAAALRNEAGRSLDHGDLPGARRRLEEALRLRVQDGEELETAAVRVDLAEVLRLAGSPRDAARLATEAAEVYGKQGMAGYRALALARLAQALVADGRAAPAQAAAKEARGIAEGNENLDQRLAVALAVAPVEAAAGDPAAAVDLLRWAKAESDRTGFLAAGLEARLELGLLQAQTGDAGAAAATLEDVRHQAELRGYRALAQRATEAQPRGGVPRP